MVERRRRTKAGPRGGLESAERVKATMSGEGGGREEVEDVVGEACFILELV